MMRLAGEIKRLFIKNNLTLSVAESCTGGLLSNLITDVGGSSQYFILGVVSYSNLAKQRVLKIPQDIIAKYGAVSTKVTELMAQSIRKIAKTDLGIGITGIAGPTGGTKLKPLGTVFIAIDSQKKKICEKFYFKGKRLTIKRKAALKTLELLKTCLVKD